MNTLYDIQVNLCQKLSFLSHFTLNMTRDCSLNSPKNTISQHVVYKYCFECQNKNKKTCCEHLFFGEFNEQSHVILWVNWCRFEVIWIRFTCNTPESTGSPGYFRGAEDCHCYTEDTTIGLEMNSNEDIEKEDVEFHYCPAHSNFKPNMHCNQHVECNDPIYR